MWSWHELGPALFRFVCFSLVPLAPPRERLLRAGAFGPRALSLGVLLSPCFVMRKRPRRSVQQVRGWGGARHHAIPSFPHSEETCGEIEAPTHGAQNGGLSHGGEAHEMRVTGRS